MCFEGFALSLLIGELAGEFLNDGIALVEELLGLAEVFGLFGGGAVEALSGLDELFGLAGGGGFDDGELVLGAMEGFKVFFGGLA